jgi:hypothetical protein
MNIWCNKGKVVSVYYEVSGQYAKKSGEAKAFNFMVSGTNPAEAVSKFYRAVKEKVGDKDIHDGKFLVVDTVMRTCGYMNEVVEEIAEEWAG